MAPRKEGGQRALSVAVSDCRGRVFMHHSLSFSGLNYDVYLLLDTHYTVTMSGLVICSLILLRLGSMAAVVLPTSPREIFTQTIAARVTWSRCTSFSSSLTLYLFSGQVLGRTRGYSLGSELMMRVKSKD